MWEESFYPGMIDECLGQGISSLVVNVQTKELSETFFEILSSFGIYATRGINFIYGKEQCYRIRFDGMGVYYGRKPTYEDTDRFGSLRLCTYTGIFPDDSGQEMEAASDEDIMKLFV